MIQTYPSSDTESKPIIDDEVYLFVDLIVDELMRRIEDDSQNLCTDCPLKSVPINPEA